MKFSLSLLFLLAGVASADHHLACTEGRLFVTAVNSTVVRVFNLDDLSTPPMEVTVDGSNFPMYLKATEHNVVAMYRGESDVGYTDGVVSVISQGIDAENHGDHFDLIESTPSVELSFGCARPIHVQYHDEKVAVFCDGLFSENITELVNATITVFDDESPTVLFDVTLPSSHHGVAIPVDENHLLHSMPTPDRAALDSDAANYSLPTGFRIVDFEGNVVDTIDDTSDPSTHCSGFHGASAIDGRFALACDETHGGILVVTYDYAAEMYSSHSVAYPLDDGFSSHRTGGFADHHDNAHVVGNFNGPRSDPEASNHLLFFDPSSTEGMTTANLYDFATRPCSFQFEMTSGGEHLWLWMPNGQLHVFSLGEAGWTEEVRATTIVEGMESCTDAMLVTGYGGHVYVLEKAMKMHVIVLHGDHVDVIQTMDLDFIPLSAAMSHVPKPVLCGAETDEGHDDHDDHDDHEGEDDHDDHDDHEGEDDHDDHDDHEGEDDHDDEGEDDHDHEGEDDHDDDGQDATATESSESMSLNAIISNVFAALA